MDNLIDTGDIVRVLVKGLNRDRPRGIRGFPRFCFRCTCPMSCVDITLEGHDPMPNVVDLLLSRESTRKPSVSKRICVESRSRHRPDLQHVTLDDYSTRCPYCSRPSPNSARLRRCSTPLTRRLSGPSRSSPPPSVCATLCSTTSSPEASPAATRSGRKSEASEPSPPVGMWCGWGICLRSNQPEYALGRRTNRRRSWSSACIRMPSRPSEITRTGRVANRKVLPAVDSPTKARPANVAFRSFLRGPCDLDKSLRAKRGNGHQCRRRLRRIALIEEARARIGLTNNFWL